MSNQIVSSLTMNQIGRTFHTSKDSTFNGVFYGHAQGMCYADGYIVYGRTPYAGGDQSNCVIRKINASTGAKTAEKSFPFYHCNSMTYDRSKNMLYVCPMLTSSGAESKALERINYSSFTSAGSKTLLYTFYACAFDNASNTLYTLRDSGNQLVADVYDTNYTHQRTITLQVPEGFDDKAIRCQSRQSFEVYDGRLYVLNAYPNTINVYDLSGKNVQNHTLPARADDLYTVGECEDIASLGDGRFYIASYYIVNTAPTPVCATGFYEINAERNAPGLRAVSIMESPTAQENFNFYVDNSKTVFNPDGTLERPFQYIEEAMACCYSDTVPQATIHLCNSSYPAVELYGTAKNVIIQPYKTRTPVVNGLIIRRCGSLVLNGLRFAQKWPTLNNEINSRIAIEYSSVRLENCSFAEDADIYTVALTRSDLTLIDTEPELVHVKEGSRLYKGKNYARKPVECDGTSQVFPFSRLTRDDWEKAAKPSDVPLLTSLTGYSKIMIEYYIADRQETAAFLLPTTISGPTGFSIHTFNMPDAGGLPTFIECNFQINNEWEIVFTGTNKCTGSTWGPASTGDFYIRAIYGIS
ncbi:MAG: hypothetical protein HFE86_00090 [Clostridiales bacterium]|nr:hypothetical protein [Clostridiales bacterium]